MQLMVNEFIFNFILLRRYWFETMASLAALLVIFFGFVFGARYVSGPGVTPSDRLDMLTLSFALWLIVLTIFSSIASFIVEESRTGTLGSLFIATGSPIAVVLRRSLANVVFVVLLNSFLVLLILWFTGTIIDLPPVIILPFIGLLFGTYGLAYTVASLAIIHKAIAQFISLCQLGLLFLIGASTTASSSVIHYVFPLSSSSGQIIQLAVSGTEPQVTAIVMALVNGLLYFALGVFVFRYAFDYARFTGKLEDH